ncbi:MAG: NAD(P)/FAD-dependent oxidoreductase [Proteobacteria bacterium]|nr:NAD(P)/FAD-dependent oxidoreductase [Pseudomonadota bacterium]
MSKRSPSQIHETDVVIIGAGPVGLFAIFQCGMLRMRCHIVDALDKVGGQCTALYPEKPLYDIPAYPQILGEELIQNLEKQAAPFSPVFHLNQQVVEISAEKKEGLSTGKWILKTSQGVELISKAIIIAAGVGAFGPNRPPLSHIECYEGKSIFYRVKKREDFRGKTIMIAGGGDSALDWAVSLSEVAKKILMVHRRPKFRGAPEMVARLENLSKTGNVEILTPYQLFKLEGDVSSGILNAVQLQDMDGAIKSVETDVLLPFFGLSMNLGPIAEWGLGLEKNHITINPATAETTTPGIFSIGDVATYPGKLKLILTGFSEAAIAAHAIFSRVFPGEALHFEYSTSKGVPGEKKH